MLTGYQRQLFSELVNLNWETDQNYPQTVKTALINEYWRVRKELEDDMGKVEYDRYINGMKQMFAPKGGYGDESPEEVNRMMEAVR
jgi:hypothetical protein